MASQNSFVIKEVVDVPPPNILAPVKNVFPVESLHKVIATSFWIRMAFLKLVTCFANAGVNFSTNFSKEYCDIQKTDFLFMK